MSCVCVCVWEWKWLHPGLLLGGGVLGACLPCTDKVAFRLDDAPALDNDGVTQDPLQPPVGDTQVLCSLLQRLFEGGCWHQLWGEHTEQREERFELKQVHVNSAVDTMQSTYKLDTLIQQLTSTTMHYLISFWKRIQG